MDDKKREEINNEIVKNVSPEDYQRAKETLEKFQRDLTNFAYSFKSEKEFLEYSKNGTIRLLENPDYIAEELERETLTYKDIEAFFTFSGDIGILIVTCKVRSWSIEKLTNTIKEQLIAYFPNENVTFDLEEEAKEYFLDDEENHIEEDDEDHTDSISYTSSSSLSSGNYNFLIDSISRSITKLEISNNERKIVNPIDVTSKKDRKKGKKVTTLVTLNNELYDDLGITNIDDFDTAVMNAIITVWENGDNNEGKITTPQQLYRIMTKNFNSRITEEIEEQILESLRKLRTYNIIINADEEADKYYPSLKDKTDSLEGTLLYTIVAKGTYNNKKSTIISLYTDTSPLYIYAKEKGQLCSVPFNRLTTNKVNKTAETIEIENFLIARIEAIPRLSNKITLETIFKETGIEEACTNATKRQRTIKKIKDLLDGYIETGYIKGYTINKKGRSQHSITIIK